MEGSNPVRRLSIIDLVSQDRRDSAALEPVFVVNNPPLNMEIEHQRLGNRRRLCKVLEWHIKQCPNTRILIVFRIISIILFLLLSVIDTVAYAAPSNPPSSTLQFIWGAKYPLYDIATIIYCSGAPVFGVSFEIFLFVSLAAVNVILQSRNCGDMQLTLVFLARVICLAIAVELAHRNFRLLCARLAPREKSSHVMLHQSLLFSLSILFFSAAGLRTVFEGALNECKFQHFICGLVKMDTPAFDAHTSCDGSFVHYVSSREELRILRNWLILNIGFYAIFNHALFDLVALKRARKWWYSARLCLVILFLALTIGYLVVNMAPFQVFKTKIVFDVIECVLFVCAVLLMIYNLVRARTGTTIDGINEAFQEDPHILPKA